MRKSWQLECQEGRQGERYRSDEMKKQGKDNGENKRGKLGKHRKGDGGDERGKPGAQSKRDDGENEHESDKKEGASERIRREATVTKLTVSAWSVRTDVRDRGWPGATVQETRGAPTQAHSAGSNRRDPGDDESRCGEAVIVREIGAAPCKILNRDDKYGDGLVVAAPVGFTVPARSPALMRTGICLDNTGEIRAEVLEIGEWCNQNCVKVSGYELDYRDGSIIVCVNHHGKKNLHVTTEEAAF